MFTDITLYMQKTREERRLHLKLDEPCIEIGANSQTCRALLAHHLETTIAKGHFVQLCHACNNHKCSNKNHLYWGSAKDNVADSIAAGTWKNLSTRTVSKYGIEKAREMRSKSGTLGGKAIRKHKRKVIIEEWQLAISEIDVTKHGWVVLMKRRMNCDHIFVRKVMKEYFPHIMCYMRRCLK